MIILGNLASATCYHIETIRYCERVGLLPRPSQASSGDRAYNVDLPNFVQHTKSLGFSSRQIFELLELSNHKK